MPSTRSRCSTGGTDRTVEVFEEWSSAERERQPGFVSTLGHFEWCDDFAAARNAADELLETDWLCWADCDDMIEGAGKLRRLLKRTPTHVTHWRFPYDRDGEGGNRWTRLRRSRVGVWVGRLHEGFRGLDSPCGDGDDIRWRSDRGGMRRASRDRDLRVLRAWTTDEPRNLRPLGMLAVAEFEAGNRDVALRCFERYVEIRYAEVDDSIARWESEAAVWALPPNGAVQSSGARRGAYKWGRAGGTAGPVAIGLARKRPTTRAKLPAPAVPWIQEIDAWVR